MTCRILLCHRHYCGYVSDFYKSNRTEKHPFNEDRSVTCAANTSEQCSYSWLKTHQDSPNNNLSEVSGATINLAEQSVDLFSIHCRAECKLRGISCVAEPLMIEFSSDKGQSHCRVNLNIMTCKKGF